MANRNTHDKSRRELIGASAATLPTVGIGCGSNRGAPPKSEGSAGNSAVSSDQNGSVPPDGESSSHTSGGGEANAAAGAELADLQERRYTISSRAGATNWPRGIPYSNVLISGIDYIINAPCCKDHLLANYTAAIKNWMGIIDIDPNQPDYGRYHAHGNSAADMGARLPALHLGVRENLVVTDASKICLTEGPFDPGQEAAPNRFCHANRDWDNEPTRLQLPGSGRQRNRRHHESPIGIMAGTEIRPHANQRST
jgi:hypothetical protein